MSLFNGSCFLMSYLVFQRSSAFTVLTSMSTNPFKSKAFKPLAQDMSLLLARSFLIVKEGPSRVYKRHLEVTSFSQLKLAGNIYCVVGLFTAQSHQMHFLCVNCFYFLTSDLKAQFRAFIRHSFCWQNVVETVGLLYILSHLKKSPGMFRMTTFLYLVPLLLQKK